MLFNATPIVLFVSLFLESSPVRKWSIYLLIAQKVWDLAFNPESDLVEAPAKELYLVLNNLAD